MTSRSQPDLTISYYDRHADDFCERTRTSQMTALYEPFLALVRPGGRILDAGCGSGRDMTAFASRGFQVSGFDGSHELARRAREHTGLPVHHLRFDEVEWNQEFDGVWACASLLHLPSSQLPDALVRLAQALKPGGVLYVSFREGSSEGVGDGRWFADQTAESLRQLITDTGALEPLQAWITRDVRPDRGDLRWINLLARRGSGILSGHT